jgi:MFS family permease
VITQEENEAQENVMSEEMSVPQATEKRSQDSATTFRWGLASLCLSILLPSLAISIANVGLPTLMWSLDVSFQAVQWVVLAYLLTITIVIVSVGRLGDLVGRRRLLLAGITLFSLASLLSGLAPSLWWLVAARTIQGLGAAMMMSLAMALVGETVPKERTGRAIGLLGTMSAIGTALGPSLGGLLIDAFGWPAIFFVSVPPGLLAIVLAVRYLPADAHVTGGGSANFDLPGTLWLSAVLAAYALAMTVGRGNFGALNGALLLGAAVGVGLFIRTERRTASPLIQLAIFRDPSLSTSLALSALVSTVMMATLVVGPFYLSRAFGLDASAVGLAVSAGPLVSAITATPAGRLVDHLGTLRTTFTGLAGIGIGAVLLSLGMPSLGIAGYIGPIVVITASYALFQTANNTGVMSSASRSQRGVISGVLNLSRNFGLITGTAVMGAVYALASASNETAPPEAAAIGLRITFAVAALLIAIGLIGAVAVRSSFARIRVDSERA